MGYFTHTSSSSTVHPLKVPQRSFRQAVSVPPSAPTRQSESGVLLAMLRRHGAKGSKDELGRSHPLPHSSACSACAELDPFINAEDRRAPQSSLRRANLSMPFAT